MDHTNEMIANLNSQKGGQLAIQALLAAVLRSLPAEARYRIEMEWEMEVEVARAILGNEPIPDEVIQGFETQVRTLSAIVSPSSG